jgi:hypothetical protein
VAGPKGDTGTGIPSLESLNGIPCNNGQGSVSVTIGAGGAISLTCTPITTSYSASFTPASADKATTASAANYRATLTLHISAPQPTDLTVSFQSTNGTTPVTVTNADSLGNLTIPAGATSVNLAVSAVGTGGDLGELVASLPNGSTATFTVIFKCPLTGCL